MAFKMLSVVGAVIASIGGVLAVFLLVPFRATPLFSIELLGVSIFMAIVGVIIYCYGAFREHAEQIRRGVQKQE